MQFGTGIESTNYYKRYIKSYHAVKGGHILKCVLLLLFLRNIILLTSFLYRLFAPEDCVFLGNIVQEQMIWFSQKMLPVVFNVHYNLTQYRNIPVPLVLQLRISLVNSAHGCFIWILDGTRYFRTPLCHVYILKYDILQGSSRLCK